MIRLFRFGLVAVSCIAFSGYRSNTVVTVRVLVKSATKVNGVEKVEWLPGTGYQVKVGDTKNAARYCSTLHIDPPGRVECAVPNGAPIMIRVERQGYAEQCPETFPTSDGSPLSVTLRIDPDRRTLSCRIVG